MRRFWIVCVAAGLCLGLYTSLWAQGLEALQGKAGAGPIGAAVTLNREQLLVGLSMIGLALVGGALLAYHPLTIGRVSSLVEMDYPKIIIIYSVVGALTGFLASVNNVLAFAIFGIGGLMRFRTEIQSTKETGRAILATVIGIIWGVGLWQVALAATALAWVLVLVLDWRVGYRMVGRGIEAEAVEASANAHREVLESYGCQITQVRKNPRKGQFSIVFKASRKLEREDLEAAFDEDVEEANRATIDWPEEG
jgi:hypothetical protein